MKNVSDKIAGTIKSRVLFSVDFFPPKSYPLWNNVENYGSTRLVTDENIMLPGKGAICVPHA